MDRHLRGKQVCVDGCLSQGSWGTAETQFFQQVVKCQDNSRQHVQGRMCSAFSQQQRVCRKHPVSTSFTGCQRDIRQRRKGPAQRGLHEMRKITLIKSSDGPK